MKLIKVSVLPVIFTMTTFVVTEELQMLSPTAVVKQSQPDEWRAIKQNNLLYLNLSTGTVIVELAPRFASQNVGNLKALSLDHFYDNMSMYRVIEGFVAQGDARDRGDVKIKKG